MARAYNDWLYEFCQENPERLLGAGMISPFDINDAVAETRRCVRELRVPRHVPPAERGERPELARSVLRAALGRARGAEDDLVRDNLNAPPELLDALRKVKWPVV